MNITTKCKQWKSWYQDYWHYSRIEGIRPRFFATSRREGEWGTVEGGNKRIANKAKGVHTGDVNGDFGVAQNNTAYREPSQSGNLARHNRGWERLIINTETCCSRNVNSCGRQREIFRVQISKEEDKTHQRSHVSHLSVITEIFNYNTAPPPSPQHTLQVIFM